jgi:hypothetical protein
VVESAETRRRPPILGVGVASSAAMERFLVAVPEAVDFVAVHLPWLALAELLRTREPQAPSAWSARHRVRFGEIAAWWPVVGYGVGHAARSGPPADDRRLLAGLARRYRMAWVSSRGRAPSLGVPVLDDGPGWAGAGPRRLDLRLLEDLARRRDVFPEALAGELPLGTVRELHLAAEPRAATEPLPEQTWRLLAILAARCDRLAAVTVTLPASWLGRAGPADVEAQLDRVRRVVRLDRIASAPEEAASTPE